MVYRPFCKPWKPDLLHDVCKANYYHRDSDGWTVRDALPMGHGEKSVYLIQKHMDLTDEEALAIRWHMGAYDEAYRGGSRALGAAMDCCALVLALHQADMRASQEEKRRAPARSTPHPRPKQPARDAFCRPAAFPGRRSRAPSVRSLRSSSAFEVHIHKAGVGAVPAQRHRAGLAVTVLCHDALGGVGVHLRAVGSIFQLLQKDF